MADRWENTLIAPCPVGVMLLLTDGSVLAQHAGTMLWWRLRPDRTGAYTTGEWRQTGQSASAPRGFASAVLADGSVLLAGGRIVNNANRPAPFAATERYDPNAEAWRTLPSPPGWPAIGDAPCCVLPDGSVLLGNVAAGPCAIWNPMRRAWSGTPAKRNNAADGECWVLLQDGSVLAVDAIGAPETERFTNGNWIDNGNTPAALGDATHPARGPAILLTDGSVLALSATEAVARFTPNPNPARAGTWAASPSLPPDGETTLGASGAPACLLPDGRVLCAAGPLDGTGATRFLVFDPRPNRPGASWTQLAAPPGSIDGLPGDCCFLLLPTGQVLCSNGTASLQVLLPDATPGRGLAPAIATFPLVLHPGKREAMQGTALNGWSQACVKPRATMATNYPLVRLQAAAPANTVVYCRTSGHDMAIATGNGVVKTFFVVPPGTRPGIYTLTVIANAIASPPVTVAVQAARGNTAVPGSVLAAAGDADSEHPFGMQEIFKRDLAEVHLLMDFISGRADKSLDALQNVPGYDASGEPDTSLSAQQVIEDICRITYPPEGGDEQNAQQAAFILLVKDRLNQKADPARGLTIAFTSMVAGVSVEFSEPTSWHGAPRQSRRFFATMAYPNLEHSARRFRKLYLRLPWIAGFLVTLILYSNWDISVCSSALRQINAARDAYLAMLKAPPGFQPSDATCHDTDQTVRLPVCEARGQWLLTEDSLRDLIGRRYPVSPVAAIVRLLEFDPPNHQAAVMSERKQARNPSGQSDAASTSAGTSPADANARDAAAPSTDSIGNVPHGTPVAAAAPQGASAGAPVTGQKLAPAASHAGRGASTATAGTQAPAAAAGAAPPQNGSSGGGPGAAQAAGTAPAGQPAGAGSSPADAQPDAPAEIGERTRLENLTQSVVDAFNGIIIPGGFGWIGTLAGVLRTTQAKLRASTLAPRDHQVVRIALILGIIAGMSVGLYYNSSDTNNGAAKTFGSTITVTAAGLCFLAGFGAETFFSFLESLLSRLWTSSDAVAADKKKDTTA